MSDGITWLVMDNELGTHKANPSSQSSSSVLAPGE